MTHRNRSQVLALALALGMEAGTALAQSDDLVRPGVAPRPSPEATPITLPKPKPEATPIPIPKPRPESLPVPIPEPELQMR